MTSVYFHWKIKVLYSELHQEWQPLPKWVRFMIQFGFNWPRGDVGHRRVSVVSMPCDSSAAGLIALGALIRDLCRENANDVKGHLDALLSYARQYLEACKNCRVRCRPKESGCGYKSEANGLVLHKGETRYWISEKTDFTNRRPVFTLPKKSLTGYPNPRNAIEWQIAGQPPIILSEQQGCLNRQIYNQIIGGTKIIQENLRKSFSGLCLAGRVAGEAATRKAYASIRFQNGIDEHGLEELLTIHGWAQSHSVSRMSFFNARTEQMDRCASVPALIIADGDTSFLKIIGKAEFQRTDVIGLINRTVDRNYLEEVGNQVLGLRKWYAEDSETRVNLKAVPRGVSMLILRKRTL